MKNLWNCFMQIIAFFTISAYNTEVFEMTHKAGWN